MTTSRNLRRIFVPRLIAGEVRLDNAAAHHVRDVLRLERGAELELFDPAGGLACGEVTICAPGEVVIRVAQVESSPPPMLEWIIASAIPKAARADWMIEKLSELGASAFIPLATERSVALPEGKNKIARWNRLAAESAKQSRRAGVMRIEELTPLEAVIERMAIHSSIGWYLSTEAGAEPIRAVVRRWLDAPAMPATTMPPQSLTLLIGPEGGWSARELARLASAGLTAVGLTATILRVETAALAAASIVAAFLATSAEQNASSVIS